MAVYLSSSSTINKFSFDTWFWVLEVDRRSDLAIKLDMNIHSSRYLYGFEEYGMFLHVLKAITLD